MKNEVTMKHIKAAIIGYWRCGASIELISEIMGLSKQEVEIILSIAN